MRKAAKDLQRGDVVPFRSLVKSGNAIVLGVDVCDIMNSATVVVVDSDVPRDKFWLKRQRKTFYMHDELDVVRTADI